MAAIITIVSLFILTPLLMVIAIKSDSVTGKVITITLTTVAHVTFWVVFGQYAENNSVFAFAGMYEFGAIVGVLYILADAIDLV